MARALRVAYAGAFYHVTCRGNARQPIFRDEHDRQAFVSRLGVSLETYQRSSNHWCYSAHKLNSAIER